MYLLQGARPARPAPGAVDVKWQLLGQIAAADIVLWLFPDLAIRSLGSYPVFGDMETGAFGLFWSLLFMLGLMNAFRAIDRLGVSAALVSSITLALLSLSAGAFVPLAISFGVSLMLLPPLCFGKGSRRLGGVQGMAVGLLLAAAGMAALRASSAVVSLPVLLALFALPVTGVAAAGLRRLLDGGSPFTAVEGFFGRALLSKGFGPAGAGILVTALSVSFAMLAVFSVNFAFPDACLSLLVLLLLVFFVLW